MGWVKIRAVDDHRARDNYAYRRVMDLMHGARTPAEIKKRAFSKIRNMGMTVVHKPSTSLRFSKTSTTYYRQVRLSETFEKLPEWKQAVTICHELGHAFDWHRDGPLTFGSRYVLSARWRYVYEMRCYRITIAIREQLRITRSSTEAYINALPKAIRKGDALRSLRSLDSHVTKILRAEIN